MTIVVTHTKVSGKPAGSDPDRVYGTHWDADHTLTGTVSNAQLDDMAEATIKGRSSGSGTGDPEDLTAAAVLTMVGGQPLDATLTALAAYNTNGLLTQTAADTFTGRTLTAPAAGISVSNGDGVAGNPTLALANDLSALEGLASTGVAVRSAADTWVQRTITGTAAEITVTNGDGVSGNPTLSLPTALTFTGKTVTGGTFSACVGSGTWTASGTWTLPAVTLGGTVSLPSSHVFNWSSSDITLTHAANLLTLAGGALSLTATTASTTTTTGTLIVAGGVGIGGAVYAGTLNAAGSANVFSFVVYADPNGGRAFGLQTSDYVFSTTGSSLRCQFGAATGDTYIGIQAKTAGTTANGNIILNEVGGNIGIGGSAPFGTSASKVLGFSAGTAPTTAPADTSQIWVKDAAGAAGKGALHMMNEAGTENLIVAGVIYKTTTGDPSQVQEGLLAINTFDNTAKIYADAAWRTIASGW